MLRKWQGVEWGGVEISTATIATIAINTATIMACFFCVFLVRCFLEAHTKQSTALEIFVAEVHSELVKERESARALQQIRILDCMEKTAEHQQVLDAASSQFCCTWWF